MPLSKKGIGWCSPLSDLVESYSDLCPLRLKSVLYQQTWGGALCRVLSVPALMPWCQSRNNVSDIDNETSSFPELLGHGLLD